MELPQTDDYRSLLLDDIPLLDVRAPVEFEQGSFPLAENFPLINNDVTNKDSRCKYSLRIHSVYVPFEVHKFFM